MVANQMAIILVQGPEEILAERQIAGIIEKLKSKDNQAVINNFSSDEVLPGMITDALAPSLFSQSRALVIKQVQDLPSECTEEIESYLENPDPELTLVLWHKGGVKGKGLVDKLKKMKADVIAVAEIKTAADKKSFVQNEFKRLQRTATADAVTALVNATGSDLRELASVCAQLSTDVTAQKTIDASDVEVLMNGRVEATGFDVADAVMSGNVDASLIANRHAISSGTDPVLIVGAIATSIRTMVKVMGANSSQNAYQLASTLALAPWQIEKARRQLSRWREETLGKAVIRLAKADSDIKGDAADPMYALERALIDIASLARS